METSLEEKIINAYAENEACHRVLTSAEANEHDFAEGTMFGPEVCLKANLSSESGLWEVLLEAKHGIAIFSELDDNFESMIILTRSNSTMETRQYFCDTKQIKSLHKFKKSIADDPVLAHIYINGTEQTIAEHIMIYLRKYRRQFKDHKKRFGFLWQDTRFRNATDLVGHMRHENLL